MSSKDWETFKIAYKVRPNEDHGLIDDCNVRLDEANLSRMNRKQMRRSNIKLNWKESTEFHAQSVKIETSSYVSRQLDNQFLQLPTAAFSTRLSEHNLLSAKLTHLSTSERNIPLNIAKNLPRTRSLSFSAGDISEALVKDQRQVQHLGENLKQQVLDGPSSQELPIIIRPKIRKTFKNTNAGDCEKETLHSLARKGYISNLRELLLQNEDVDKRDSYGKTALHCAVSASQLETVTCLLHHNANPNLKDHREEAPLHAAVRTGNIDVIERLLRHRNTNVNIEGRNRYTPLHLAAHLEHKNATEICQKLLDCGADYTTRGLDNMTPMSVAALKGNRDILELFLKKCEATADQQQTDLLHNADFEGSTLLHLAIDSGVLKVVKLCLEYGCSITAVKRSDGGTPIHWASRLGALEIMKCLYEHDQDSFEKSGVDSEGMTPLHRAAMYNHRDVVQFLVDHMADLNPLDEDKCTPLVLAAAQGCFQVVSLLLERGADVTCKDKSDRTSLHWAVGQDKTIERLLKDELVRSYNLVNHQDCSGATPLHLAAQGGYLKSVLLLLKNGSDPGIKNHKLETALHLAASNGWLPIVKKLMEGRQTRLMNVGNLSDHTPLHLAAANGQDKVVKFLLDRGATVERDTEGRTPIHFAAAKGSLKSVELICETCPNSVNDEDNADQDTALHIAAKNGHAKVVKYLMSLDCQSITYNAYNQNALDVAIASGKEDVALEISQHNRWREMCHRVEEGFTQLQYLAIKMPSVAEKFLDRCVEEVGKSEKGEDYSVTYDFMFLQGMPDIRKDDPKKFLDVLHTMVKYKRVGCLAHPVCGAIMNIKWRNVGWKAYVMNLTFYVTFLIMLTTVTVTMAEQWKNKDDRSVAILDVPKYTIIIISVFHIIKELFQIWDEKFKYILKADNWMEWFLYMSSLVYMVNYGNSKNEEEVKQLAAVAIFIAWILFVLYLRRFSTFGIYIIMMTNIIRTLVKIIILFFPFIIGFGIPFFLLLHQKYVNEDEPPHIFDTLPISFFTTFMLILGEMKYPHTVYKYQPLPYPWISYAIYMLFGICVPIIVKNLLIGLSVGDVNRILQSAKMEQHAMQVELLLELERATPRRILRKLWVSHFVDYPNRKKTFMQKLVDIGSPKKEGNQRQYVNPAILQLGNRVDNLAEKVESQQEKLQNIIRLLSRLDQRLSEAVPGIKPVSEPVQSTAAATSQSSKEDRETKV